MRWAAFVCVLVGCIHDDLVHCADGNACPVGLVCDPAHRGCATQEQIDACRDLPDLEACLTDATCHEGVCLPNGCGNGRTDPPEACDDGNTASGDGCASDCSSNETCGNGTTDLIELETCDDGNHRSHDGCDSLCNVEEPRWRQLLPGLGPILHQHAAAFDPVRRRVIVFGGAISSIETARTYEYSIDAATWFDVTPTISPPARVLASMVYDAALGEMVLFGGYAQGSLFHDTWLWNGRTWTESEDAGVAPSARYGASMAYDSRREKIVLYGGEPATSTTTWEWDGTWHAEDVPGAPASRLSAPMAYDPRHAEIVLTGGLTSSLVPIDDGTWLWDGSTWRHSTASAGARYDVPMVFDAKHDAMLVVGPVGTTFLWDGQTWSQLGVFSSFFDGLRYFAMFYDPLRETVMTHGGSTSTGPTGAMYRWTTSNNAWIGFAPTPIPALTAFSGMAYDGSRHQPVRFGGYDSSTGLTNTTLDLVDDAWVVRAASTPPVPRNSPQLVFDTTLARLLLFGGDQADPQTYAFANNAWSSIASGAPTVVEGAAIYDPDDHVVMHFGGRIGSNAVADTYVFDGAWHQVAAPSATRRAHALVYDESSKHAVMVTGTGGSAQTPQEADTWLWTSTQGWTQQLPATVPASRLRATSTYDPLRREVVLFGGQAATLYLDDTWSWNGTKWSQLDIDVPPAASDRSCMTYDRLHERAVMMGEDGTYVLQWTSRIRDEVCQVGFDRDGDGLKGCDDPDCADICAMCGNAVCDAAETCRNCPVDCGACTPLCGDIYCDGGEAQSCPAIVRSVW